MKKVICLISDRQTNYIFDVYLIKEKKGKAIVMYKVPFAIKKDEINCERKAFDKKADDFRKLLFETLSSYKYINTHLIIALDTLDTLREEINLPILNNREFKIALDLEISKRYNNQDITNENGDYVKYLSKVKKDNYYIAKLILVKRSLKDFIDKVFLPLPYNIKGLVFFSEYVNDYLRSHFKKDETNYLFILGIENRYVINVVCDGYLKYTYSQNKDSQVLTRIISLYHYYENNIKENIFLLDNDEESKINLQNKLKEFELFVREVPIDIKQNERVDINSLLYRKLNDYEKI